jgi:hypothetical protein
MALARLRPSSVRLTECRPPEMTSRFRVGDAGCIGLARAQVAEGLPSLRLAAGRLVQLVDDVPRGHVGPVTGFDDLGLELGREMLKVPITMAFSAATVAE